ncbi:GntR family transcriptional regulator [Synoicihabitans lomoniglobus]|uniref:GntR family transcriptional regulator n=1 Tax=Synoicihabitans lomoniglobus TaxID=2909285 RepID=A0AAE9ZZS9_9BACT|nr:GntR family transcriptional regulator [Opitutaceae bacterium LMO-M01]WED63697.1 GntR family transcriptional regulator [Opitutaceae bacterium LMO-M01]
MKSVNTDVAYDYVRRRILSGEYPPGHALITEGLSTATGVSRTPVRDALRKLEADGLVTIRAHAGASVKIMDLKEFKEMCDLRLALESHAAGLAAQYRNERDLAEMRHANSEMKRLTGAILKKKSEEPLISELVREDVRFHIAIMTAARNDLIKKEILRLHLINRVVSGQNGTDRATQTKALRDVHRQEVLESHNQILTAIEAGDAAGAKQAMEHHIQDIIDNRLSAMVGAESGLITHELTDEELVYSP